MSLAAAGRMRMEMCSSLVCLDNYDNYQMSGRVYHNCLCESKEVDYREAPKKNYMEGMEFQNFSELIDILEEVYNKMDYPQSSVELRTFGKTERNPVVHKRTSKMSSEQGKKATFVLKVLFRQNASWQGTIKWMEEDKSENFRSLLELMKLMRSTVPEEPVNEETESTNEKVMIRKVI